MTKATKRVVRYERISHDETGARRGVTTQGQDNAASIESHADWQMVARPFVDNDITANGTKKRPEFERMMALCETGAVDVIVALSWDRLSRNRREAVRLIEVGKRHNMIISLDKGGEIDMSTYAGRMFADMLAMQAQAEIDQKSERQIRANEYRVVNGVPYGGGPRPFGYNRDGTAHATEANVLRWAAQAALDGLSLRKLAVEIAARSDRPVLTHGGVRNLLLNPRNIGIRTYHGVEVGPGTQEAILDLDLYRRLRTKLTNAKRDPLHGRVGGRVGGRPGCTLLTGIARCGKCTKALVGSARRATASSEPRLAYTCNTLRGHVYPHREASDEAVVNKLVAIMMHPNFIDIITPDSDDRAARAQGEIDKLNRRIAGLARSYAEGVYDENEDAYREITDDLIAQREAHRQVIAEVTEMGAFDGLSVGSAEVVEQFEALPLERRRIIAAQLVSVTAMPTGKGARWDVAKHLIVTPIGKAAKLA